jgi:hypothetical protein
MTEKVETLLKIGLGPFGKVRRWKPKRRWHANASNPTSGRSCAGTIHVHSSAATEREREEGQRQVQSRASVVCPADLAETGSLSDKTVRLPMDSPVFDKLQQMILYDVKSRQWYVTTITNCTVTLNFALILGSEWLNRRSIRYTCLENSRTHCAQPSSKICINKHS